MYINEIQKKKYGSCHFKIIQDDWDIGYENLKLFNFSELTKNKCMDASSLFLAHSWEGRGDTFGVVNIYDIGKISGNKVKIVKAHETPITDLKFSPFYPSLIASIAQDGILKIWDIPECDTEKMLIRDDVGIFKPNKVTQHRFSLFDENDFSFFHSVQFNPIADFIIVTAGPSNSLNFWDLNACRQYRIIGISEAISSVQWNLKGTLLSCSSVNKMCGIYDPRVPQVVMKWQSNSSHTSKSSKSSKIFWLDGLAGSDHFVLTTGNVNKENRGIKLWDIRKPEKALVELEIDEGTQPLICYWDETTGLLLFTAFNEEKVLFYHANLNRKCAGSEFELIGKFKISSPMKGFTFLPKHALNFPEREVIRMLHTENLKSIYPTSFIVSDSDCFYMRQPIPSFIIPEPSLTAKQWIEGMDALPERISTVKDSNETLSLECYVEQPSKTPNLSPRPKYTSSLHTTRAVLLKKLMKQEKKFKKLKECLKNLEKRSLIRGLSKCANNEKEMKSNINNKDCMNTDENSLNYQVKLFEIIKSKEEEICRLKSFLTLNLQEYNVRDVKTNEDDINYCS